MTRWQQEVAGSEACIGSNRGAMAPLPVVDARVSEPSGDKRWCVASGLMPKPEPRSRPDASTGTCRRRRVRAG